MLTSCSAPLSFLWQGRVFELGKPSNDAPTAEATATPSRVLNTAGAATADAARLPIGHGRLTGLVSAVVGVGIGFLAGSSSSGLTLPSQPANVAAITPATMTQPAARQTTSALAATSRSDAAADRVSLTVSEQRERQAIRVSSSETRLEMLRREVVKLDEYAPTRLQSLKDRLHTDQIAIDNFEQRLANEKEQLARRIAMQELRIRDEKESLAELSRIVGERGEDASAVKLGIFPPSDAAPNAVGPGVRLLY